MLHANSGQDGTALLPALDEGFSDPAIPSRERRKKKWLKTLAGSRILFPARGNLYKTAKTICEQFGGVFPDDFQTILSLKGIGRYSAGAIASIAYQECPSSTVMSSGSFRASGRPETNRRRKK